MSRIMLYDGNGTDHWYKIRTDGSCIEWTSEDGVLTVAPGTGSIVSKDVYRDAHIHIEWREPDMPEATGQYKGNSGVYIHGCYEVQILDSYGIEKPLDNDCGGIYQMHAPLTNACKPALEWQTYDILFRAPRFCEDGSVSENARVTILQNGVCIQNNAELYSVTPGGLTDKVVEKGPLMLQDHQNLVSFRNLWIEEL